MATPFVVTRSSRLLPDDDPKKKRRKGFKDPMVTKYGVPDPILPERFGISPNNASMVPVPPGPHIIDPTLGFPIDSTGQVIQTPRPQVDQHRGALVQGMPREVLPAEQPTASPSISGDPNALIQSVLERRLSAPAFNPQDLVVGAPAAQAEAGTDSLVQQAQQGAPAPTRQSASVAASLSGGGGGGGQIVNPEITLPDVPVPTAPGVVSPTVDHDPVPGQPLVHQNLDILGALQEVTPAQATPMPGGTGLKDRLAQLSYWASTPEGQKTLLSLGAAIAPGGASEALAEQLIPQIDAKQEAILTEQLLRGETPNMRSADLRGISGEAQARAMQTASTQRSLDLQERSVASQEQATKAQIDQGQQALDQGERKLDMSEREMELQTQFQHFQNQILSARLDIETQQLLLQQARLVADQKMFYARLAQDQQALAVRMQESLNRLGSLDQGAFNAIQDFVASNMFGEATRTSGTGRVASTLLAFKAGGGSIDAGSVMAMLEGAPEMQARMTNILANATSLAQRLGGDVGQTIGMMQNAINQGVMFLSDPAEAQTLPAGSTFMLQGRLFHRRPDGSFVEGSPLSPRQ